MNAGDSIARLIALLDSGMTWKAALDEIGNLQSIELPELRAVDYLVSRAGVAPGETLRGLQAVLNDDRQALRRIELAAAAPKATIRLVVWLPVITLVLGQLVGLGSIAVLASQPLALVAVCLGAALLIAGQAWASRMLKRSQTKVDFGNLPYLLVGVCLRAGFDYRFSLELAHDAFEAAQLNFDFAGDELLQQSAALSQRTGTALADLVTALALERQQSMTQARLHLLETLSVRLMIPLGATVLPAFALLAVVPLSIGFISKNS